MYTGSFVFSELTSYLPLPEFRQCVSRYDGNYKTHSFSCLDQYLCMMFAQLTYRESLRDIESCLRAMQPKLYHMGIRGRVSRSTLADANENRDWRIYADFAQVLIHQARKLYQGEPLAVDLDEAVYALDSTTIDLCLSLFPWAQFRKQKGAIKLHTLLDLRGNIPSFIKITTGLVHDVNILDHLVPEPGSFYIMDRGYIDFERLYHLHQHSAYFVTRAKSNFKFERLYSQNVDKSTGLRYDQIGRLTGFYTAKKYPEKIRQVKFYDTDTQRTFVYLTNNMFVSALIIAQLFKCRWNIEVFFKWIKQHLRIKAFYGTSENAVKTQIWSAISVYVLVAIVKKKLNLKISLYTFLQILSISLFEKVNIYQLLTNYNNKNQTTPKHNQLNLFKL